MERISEEYYVVKYDFMLPLNVDPDIEEKLFGSNSEFWFYLPID